MLMTEITAESSPAICIDLTAEHPIRVLHVDDEAGLLKIAKRCLELEGSFEVDTASSVDEALRKIKKKDFDVVVSDYMMPGKDGLDFLKALKDTGSPVPFIMFTGKGREEVAIKALNLGADQYLNKTGDPGTVYGELAHSIKHAMQRKKAEDRVRDSEEQLRSIFDATVEGIAHIDTSGKIVAANKRLVEDMLGYRMEDTIGKNFAELGRIDPKELPRVLDAMTKVVATGSSIKNFETILVKQDGRRIPVEISTGITKKEDKIVGITTTVRDVTERKEVHESLKESEEKFRNLAEQSPSMIFINKGGRVVYANSRCTEIMGYSKEQLYSPKFNFFALIAPESRNLVKTSFRKHLEGTEIPPYEYTLITKKGKRIPALLTTKLLKYNGETAILGTVTDITEPKRLEQLYKNVVELSPDSIVTVDAKGVLTSCNAAASRMLGFSKEELVGKHFSKTGVLRARDLVKFVNLFGRAIRGKITEPLELTFYNKNGTPILCEVRIGLVREGGKIVGLQSVSRDITERKKAHKALRESQQKFEQLFMDNPEATVFLDQDMLISDINPRFTQLFGFSLSEIKGRHLDDVVVPDTKKAEGARLSNKASEGYVYFDTERKRKDGRLIPVSISAAPIKIEKRAIGYVGIYKDISEQKRAENELLESRKHFQTLFDLMVDPVAIVDRKGKILEVTKSVEDISGFKREELVGKNFLRTKIATTKSKATMMKNLAKRMMGAHMAPYDVDILTKSGKKIPYELNAAKVEYKGKPADLVIFRDVSQRKKMEEKLRVVGSLTRHDVRNKLTTVTGNLYLARQSLAGNKETLGYLSDAESAIRQIQGIFDFAKDYEKLGVEELTQMDVGRTFDDAVSLFSNLENVSIINGCKGLAVLSDSLLRQLFYNLIDNSMRHGQNVTRIKLHIEKKKKALELTYEDDGRGISTREKKLIFKEGYGKHTGYGLYLTKKLCEVYGWSIEEKGKSNEGVRFVISIPEDGERAYKTKGEKVPR